ncbi:MAG: MFS transporter [Bauldia sp.]|nr:MFS transporter [Bauldia sp.]
MDMAKVRSPLRGTGDQWTVLVALGLSMLLASLGTSIANIALPALSKAFSAPFHQVQWVVIAYLATLTILVVFVGRLGDIHGLKRMHLAGLGLFSVASLLCGVAPDLGFLIAARALQGIGAAFLMTLTIALVRETSGEDRIGRAMGMLGTMSALGTALGPSIGGFLIATTGWRGVFLVQLPLALLALILASASLPRADARSKSPMLDFGVLRGSGLLPNLSINLLVAAVMMTTLVVGPFYLALGLGLTDLLVGLVMSVGPAISILTGVPSGQAVDKWGPRRVLVLGLTMLAVGAFSLSILPDAFGLGGYVAAVAILTPGYQLFQAANNTTVMAEIPKERRGVVSGLLNLSRNLGLIGGASAMGAVFAFGVGTSDFSDASAAAITGGMRLTFILAGILMVVALWIAFARSTRIEAT